MRYLDEIFFGKKVRCDCHPWFIINKRIYSQLYSIWTHLSELDPYSDTLHRIKHRNWLCANYLVMWLLLTFISEKAVVWCSTEAESIVQLCLKARKLDAKTTLEQRNKVKSNTHW